MTTTPPQDQPTPPRGFGIDPRLGAATLRAPAASKEDYCPQAILKLHRSSSLDYRVRHKLPVLDLKDLIHICWEPEDQDSSRTFKVLYFNLK